MQLPGRFVAATLTWSASVGALLALADIEPGSAAHTVVVTTLLIPSPLVAAVLLERGLRRDRLHRPAKRIGPILVPGARSIVAGPLGLVSAVAFALAGAILWRLVRRRDERGATAGAAAMTAHGT